MITPTIGRIVWFNPGPRAPYPKVHDQPHAAIITDVQSPSVVNLAVFAPSGDLYPARGVLLIQDGETAPTDGAYAEWMPYQKGQAAKTEALQTALNGPAGDASPPASAPAAPPHAEATAAAPAAATGAPA